MEESAKEPDPVLDDLADNKFFVRYLSIVDERRKRAKAFAALQELRMDRYYRAQSERATSGKTFQKEAAQSLECLSQCPSGDGWKVRARIPRLELLPHRCGKQVSEW